MKIEETIFGMTEAANELYSYGEYAEAILLLQSIDRLCDSNSVDMPDEGTELNVELDEKFNTHLFACKNDVPSSVKEIIMRGGKK